MICYPNKLSFRSSHIDCEGTHADDKLTSRATFMANHTAVVNKKTWRVFLAKDFVISLLIE